LANALQAWIFPALYTKNPQRLYAFAAIYALPAAFQLDSSSAWYYVTYGLCAIHFQVHCLSLTSICKCVFVGDAILRLLACICQ
jgi:hypothetical protein